MFGALEAVARLHRQTNQQLAGAAFAKVVVGLVEGDQGIVQLAERTLRVLIDALTAEVDDLRPGGVVHQVALLLQHEVVGQIGDEKTEAFVQHARMLPGGAPHHISTGADAIDRLGFRVIEAGGVVALRQPAPGKQFMPVEGLQQQCAGSGKMADAMLHRAVGVQQLRTAGRHLGILVHIAHQRLKRVADQQGVAVQVAGIARPRHPHPEIGIADIAPVNFVSDEDHCRERRGHHVRAAVAGVIVDADHLKPDPAGVLVNGGNAIAQQAPGVVARDDNGKIQPIFHRFLLVVDSSSRRWSSRRCRYFAVSISARLS